VGLINVPGLGIVEIAGDTPTEAEDREMLQLLAGREAAPPAQAAAPGGLTRAFAAGVLDVPRGVAQTGAAVMEAAGIEGPGHLEEIAARQAQATPADATLLSMMGDYVPRTPSREVLESTVTGIEEAQQSFYQPTFEGSGIDALKALGEGRVGDFMSWMGESTTRALPGIGVAMASLPTSVVTVVGDIAKERAATRGDNDIRPWDVVVAAGFGTASQYLDRALGRVATGAKPLHKAIPTGVAIEAASGGIEKVGAQLLTREGDEYIAGVSPADVGEAALTEAMIAGPLGAGIRGAAALKRLPSERQVSRLEGELEAIEKRQAAEAPPAPEVAVAEEVITEEVVTPTEEVVAEERRIATGFSGTGTVESALTGVRSVHAVEHDPKVVEQYNKAHGTSYKPRSIVDVDPAEIAAESPDVYHASPVCKNFSKAKRLRTADKSDVASAEAVSRVIREAEPPVVTVENVPAYKDTALFRLITDALDAKGYTWDVVEHDAADYGAPQSRKRILLRAVREGSLPPLPPKTAPGDWYAAVEDLIADAPESAIPRWERDRIARMVKRGTLDITKPILTMGGSAGRGVAAAVNAGSPSKTLKATPKEVPRILMPDGTVKRVTPRMMARLMGLPDTLAIPDHHGLAKTVLGNGVSGEVTRSLIQPLVDRSTPTTEEVAETVLEVVPGAEPGAKRTLAPREVIAVAEEVTPQEAEALVAEGRRQRRAERAARREAAKLREEIAPRPRREAVGGQVAEVVVEPGDGLQQLRAASLDPSVDPADVEAALARAATQEEGAVASRKVDYEDDLRAALEEQGVDYDRLTQNQRMAFNDMVNLLDARDLRGSIVVTPEGVPSLQQTTALEALVSQAAAGNRKAINAAEVLALNNARATAKRAQKQIKEFVSREDVTAEQLALGADMFDKAAQAEIQATLGLRFGAGEVGRAMRAMQYVIREDLTLADAKASAIIRQRRQLTKKEEAAIEKRWAKVEAKEARADRAHKAAMAALKKAIAAYEKATPGQRTPANTAVLKARDNVVKAKRAAQNAKLEKSAASKEAVEPWFMGPYRNVFGAGVALNSAGDASALGRQAIFLALQNPVEAIKTGKWMFKAAPWNPGHREFARKEMENMLASRVGKMFTKAGGELTEVEGMSNRPDAGPLDAREEAFMFRVLETGWLGDNIIVPSQNIFALTLNRMRLANFSKGMELLSDELGGADKISRQDAEGLARLISVSTGRGEWGTGKAMGVARHFMFAPRFTLSRVENLYRAGQLLTGQGAWVKGLSPEARRLYGNRVARNMGFAMSMAMLAAYASSDSPEEARGRIDDFFDPASADFLKMRVGDTHIDLLGGTSATVRYLLPMLFRPTEADKWENPLSGKGIQGYLYGLAQFGNNKLAPLYQALREVGFGLDWRFRDLDDLPKEDDVGRVIEDWMGGDWLLRGTAGVAGGGRAAAEASEMPLSHEKVMDGALAYALNRFLFPAMGVVTPITLRNAASTFVKGASGADKKLVEDRLGELIPEVFGLGVSKYKPTKRGKKGVPGMPRIPRAPRMERW